MNSIKNQNTSNDINKLKEEVDKINQRIYNIEQQWKANNNNYNQILRNKLSKFYNDVVDTSRKNKVEVRILEEIVTIYKKCKNFKQFFQIF